MSVDSKSSTAVGIRYASHFLAVLRKLNRQFLNGGEGALRAVSEFLQAASNIEGAQAWVAGEAHRNERAAALCSDFGFLGGAILNLVQSPIVRIRWSETAAAASRQIGRKAIEGRCLNQAGASALKMGRFDDAARFEQQALVILEEAHDRHGQGAALGNLANIAIQKRDPDKGIDYLTRAIGIYEDLSAPAHIANAYNSLGVAYKQREDYARALQYHVDAATIFESLGDDRGVARTQLNRGVVLKQQGSLHEARSLFDAALSGFRKLGDRRGEGEALWCLAQALHTLGDSERAIEVAQGAALVRKQIGDPRLPAIERKLQQWMTVAEKPHK